MEEASQPRSLLERWRSHVIAQGTSESSVSVLEGQLRHHATTLVASGLDADEAFFVALRRVGLTDQATREHALATFGELFSAAEQGSEDAPTDGAATKARSADVELWVMLACAVAAAVAIKVPALFGLEFDGDGGSVYARNLSLFVLPFLTVYLAWKRGLGAKIIGPLIALFAVAGVVVNAYPFVSGGDAEILVAIHLPIALWLVVGVAHAGGEWKADAKRMEYVRFTGEWLVTFALIALGGGVLIGLTVGVFGAIGVDTEGFISEWVLPCGMMGAVVVAAWLVETQRRLVGGMAPMLSRVFTPLFAIMLAALLTGVVWTRGFVDVEREVLILLDLLLVVVLALVLYSISARDALERARLFDVIQIGLVLCALAVDVFALVAIGERLAEFGFSANKTAALGLNLILLANLTWSAVLQIGFTRARRSFDAVESWQTRYLPVYAMWAVVVVVLFPLVFAFA